MREAAAVPRPRSAHAAHWKARQRAETPNMHAQLFFWTEALMSCSLDAGPLRCSAAQGLTAGVQELMLQHLLTQPGKELKKEEESQCPPTVELLVCCEN